MKLLKKEKTSPYWILNTLATCFLQGDAERFLRTKMNAFKSLMESWWTCWFSIIWSCNSGAVSIICDLRHTKEIYNRNVFRPFIQIYVLTSVWIYQPSVFAAPVFNFSLYTIQMRQFLLHGEAISMTKWLASGAEEEKQSLSTAEDSSVLLPAVVQQAI